MERSKFARFIDNSSIILIAVILFFFTLKKYLRNNLLCITIAFVFGFFMLKILLYFQNRKYYKLNIQKEEKRHIEEINFILRTMDSIEQVSFFSQLLKNQKTEKLKGGLLVNGSLFMFFNLYEDSLSSSFIINTYLKIKEYQKVFPSNNIQEVVLICNSINDETKIFLTKFTNIKFTIFTPIETYAIMKNNNLYPDGFLTEKPQNTKKIIKINNIFNQNKAKTLFKSSALIYFSSLFIPFTKYYLITAGVLFILGIFCLLKNKPLPISSLSKSILLENNLSNRT